MKLIWQFNNLINFILNIVTDIYINIIEQYKSKKLCILQNIYVFMQLFKKKRKKVNNFLEYISAFFFANMY